MISMKCAVLAAEANVAGALDEATMNAIKSGFDTLKSTVSQVVPITVVAAVSIIAITAGANFALKKLKGVMSKAS